MPGLTDLPYDCINVIFEFVESYRQICRLAQTCWYLHEQAQEEILWEQLCRVNLPRAVYLAEKKRCDDSSNGTFVSWQRVLRRVMRGKKMDTLVAFITQGAPAATTKAAKVDEAMRHLIDVSFRDGGCIGTVGAANLSRAMTDNERIETIDLSGQLIRDAGFAPLSGTLVTCRSLTHISLAENKLGAPSHAALHTLIAEMKSLVSLDVSNNPGLSMTSIADALGLRCARKNSPIEKLYLDGIPFPSATEVRSILDVFTITSARNASLRVLSLRSTSIPNKAHNLLLSFIDEWFRRCGCGQTVVNRGTKQERTVSTPSLILNISDLPFATEKTANRLPAKGEQVKELQTAVQSGAVRAIFTEKDGKGDCCCM